MADAKFCEVQVPLFVASAVFGEVELSIFVAGAIFGEVQVSLSVASAIFGEVELSLFMAGAVLREIWNDSRRSRKGRARNRMESVQEVTIKSYRHMFVLSYMYFAF